MLEQQKPIAEWMRAVMARKNISARAWAEKARLGKDTVSRAVRDDYDHVTSTTTLAKLAEAVDERMPGLAGVVPSAATLAEVLKEIHLGFPGAPQPTDDVLRGLAQALRDTLLQLAHEPEAADDPKALSMLARVSTRQIVRSSAG